VSEVPTAGVQIAVPALAVTAMVVVAHLLHLLLDAVRRPLAALAAPHTPPLMCGGRPARGAQRRQPDR
jgi:hypothetical protein